MEQHHETALKDHLETLTPQEIRNLKSHANAVDSEDHSSAKALVKWAAGALAVFLSPGAIWKIVKVVKAH